MHFVRFLPVRWHGITRELAKFGTIGVINTLVNFVTFNVLVLTVFPDGQLKANVVATVVATTGAYFMNRHWTYQDRPKSALRREYVLFFAFNLIGLGIELGVLALAKYGLDITNLAALNVVKTLGILLATTFRFWAYRTHVFRAGPSSAAASPADLADVAPEDAPSTRTLLADTAPPENTFVPPARSAFADNEPAVSSPR